MLDKKTKKDLDWLYNVTKPITFDAFDGGAYEDRVPPALMAIWDHQGLASWADGAYQNIEPQYYVDLISQSMSKECSIDFSGLIPFVLTAFGQILGWDSNLGVINFDLQIGRAVIERSPEQTKARKPGNIEVSLGFSTHDPNQYNYGLFTKASNKFGRLAKDEMYYFERPLILGGNQNIDNVVRGNAQVHWRLLSNISDMKLYYYQGRFPDLKLVLFER